MNKKENHTPPFFIVGRGRSGTDLLQRVLNTNSDIVIPPETSVLPLTYSKYHNKNWGERLLKSFVKDVFLDDKIKKWWKIGRREFRKYIFSTYPKNYSLSVQALYKLYAQQQNRENALIGDKNPANSLYLNEIANVFPKAKIIVLVRNPIDNVYSFKNVQFDSNDTKVLAHRWNFYNKELNKWVTRYPEKFLVVKFEKLVSNPTAELSKISSFIGVEDNFDLERIESGDNPWQNNLGSKISSKHTEKGINNLSEEEIRYISNVCGETASKFGYNLEYSASNKLNVKAMLLNMAEKHYIKLPLYLSSMILRKYRNKVGIFPN